MGDLSISTTAAGLGAIRTKVTLFPSNSAGAPILAFVESSSDQIGRLEVWTDSGGELTVADLPASDDFTVANVFWTAELDTEVPGHPVFTKTFTKESGDETLAETVAAIDENLGSGTRLVDLADVQIDVGDLEDGDSVGWVGDHWERLALEPRFLALETDWTSCFTSTHSWLWRDAVRYTAEGDWDETGDRILYVPDRGSAAGTAAERPYRRDDGEWSTAIRPSNGNPLPGALWIPASEKFNFQPSGRSDPLGVNGEAFFSTRAVAAGLTTGGPLATDFFNAGTGYARPILHAYVARLIEGVQGMVTDGIEGSITIGADDTAPTHLGVTTEFGDPWPDITYLIDNDQTFGVIVSDNGGSTFVEVNYRDTNGDPVTYRQSVVLDDQVGEEQMCQQFTGFIHQNWIAAAKLHVGAHTEDDIDAIRAVMFRDFLPATSPSPADELPITIAGGRALGDIELADSVTLIQRLGLVNAFEWRCTSVFGVSFSQIYDLVIGRAVLSIKSAAVGSGGISVVDAATIIRGSSGQTTDLIGYYKEDSSTILGRVAADGSMVVRQISTPSAPGANYSTLWPDAGGHWFIRNNGGAALAIFDAGHFTQKGDLLTSTAAGAGSRLGSTGAGTGDVLMADAAETTGLKWHAVVDTQSFGSSGTWNRPLVGTIAHVRIWQPGGGSASGRKGAAGSARGGGGGGSGGQYSDEWFLLSSLGTSETVTIGAAGSAGAAVSANSTDGNDGGTGGACSFGTWLTGIPGFGGSKGTTAGGAGGTGLFGNAAGGNGSVSSAALGGSAVTPMGEGSPGGGGGGGISSGNAGQTGGNGGEWYAHGLTGGALGASGVAGTPGANHDEWSRGQGGGGGGDRFGGGAGGRYGAGAGAGGAGIDSSANSGAGALGGVGLIVVQVY